MKRSRVDEWIEESTGISPLTRKALKAYQLDQINQLLQYAKAGSCLYSYLPERVTSLKEFENIRFTDEEMLTTKSEKMVLVSQSDISRIITMETSGTTGKCKRLFYTSKDQELTVGFFTCGLSEFVSNGEITMICMPYEKEGSIGALVAKALTRLGAVCVYCGVGKTFKEMYQMMNENRVEHVVALPMHMLSLGRWIRANELSITLKSILVSADNCPYWLSQELGKSFNCEVFNHYGSRESGLGGAVECGAHDGMHVREKDLYIEIVDEKGNVLPNGQFGELVITTLHRQAMPLIRYRTKDYTRILSLKCACGGITLRLDKVVRKESIAMQAFDEALFSIKEVLDCKITKDKDGITIDIVTANEVSKTYLYHKLQKVNSFYFPNTKIDVHIIIDKERNILPCYLGKRCICAVK